MKKLTKVANCQCGSDRIEIRTTSFNPGKGEPLEVRMHLECDECRADCPSLTVGGRTLLNDLVASWNDQQEGNRTRWTK